MSNSTLVTYIWRGSKTNCNPRNHIIDTITIHHWAGNGTLESCFSNLAYKSDPGSVNYGIDEAGTIGVMIDENMRAWTSNSPSNDHRAVTIEASNNCAPKDGNKVGWTVSDKTLASIINLCADICKRNGKSKLIWCGSLAATNARSFAANEMRMTLHKWFTATGCPGPYLEGKMAYIADQVTKKLGGSSGGGTTSDTVYRVQVGAYQYRANAETMLASLKSKGYDGFIVQAGNVYRVQVGAFKSKANADVMLVDLKSKGFDGFVTTSNAPAPTPKKSIDEIAREVIRGDWGVDPQRTQRLTAAGYDAKAVQARVNQLI